MLGATKLSIDVIELLTRSITWLMRQQIEIIEQLLRAEIINCLKFASLRPKLLRRCKLYFIGTKVIL